MELKLKLFHLSQQGEVWSFGCGYFGQLGLGTNSKTSIPERISFPTTSPMVAIGTNYFHGVSVKPSLKILVCTTVENGRDHKS